MESVIAFISEVNRQRRLLSNAMALDNLTQSWHRPLSADVSRHWTRQDARRQRFRLDVESLNETDLSDEQKLIELSAIKRRVGRHRSRKGFLISRYLARRASVRSLYHQPAIDEASASGRYDIFGPLIVDVTMTWERWLQDGCGANETETVLGKYVDKLTLLTPATIDHVDDRSRFLELRGSIERLLQCIDALRSTTESAIIESPKFVSGVNFSKTLLRYLRYFDDRLLNYRQAINRQLANLKFNRFNVPPAWEKIPVSIGWMLDADSMSLVPNVAIGNLWSSIEADLRMHLSQLSTVATKAGGLAPPADPISYDDIQVLAGVLNRKTIQTYATAWKRQCPVIADTSSYRDIRPLLIKQWKRKELMFPKDYAEMQQILETKRRSKQVSS